MESAENLLKKICKEQHLKRRRYFLSYCLLAVQRDSNFYYAVQGGTTLWVCG